MAVVATKSSAVTWTREAHDLYDAYTINGIPFAVFKHGIRTSQDIEIDMTGYNVIFLKPIQAQQGITIKAKLVLALGELTTKAGGLKIETEGNTYLLGAKLTADAVTLRNRRPTCIGSKLTSTTGDTVIDAEGDITFLPVLSTRRIEVQNLIARSIAQRNGARLFEALVQFGRLLDDPLGTKKKGLAAPQAVAYLTAPAPKPASTEEKKS